MLSRSLSRSLRPIDAAGASFASRFTTFITPAAGATFQDSSGNTQPSWCSDAWIEHNTPVHSAAGWVMTNDWFISSGNPGADIDGSTLFVAFTVDSGSANEGIVGCRTATSTDTKGWDARRTTPNTVVSAGDGADSESQVDAYTNAAFASLALTFDQAGSDSIVVHRDGALAGPVDLTAIGDVFLTGVPMDVGAVAETIGLNGVLHGFVWNETPLSASDIAALHAHFATIAA